MVTKKNKEVWFEVAFWLIISITSGWLIALGVRDYVDQLGFSPLFLVAMGVIGIVLAVKFKKIRTLTSLGNKRK